MSQQQPPTTYPKARIDALTDGIYAVAMTLLVLDIRLPEHFRPQDGQALLDGLKELWPRFMPYLISFVVLGRRWLTGIGDRGESGPVPEQYTRWWLLNLLLVTCVPFTTVVLGRYASFAAAVWLYAGTTLAMSLVSFRMLALMPDTHSAPALRERRFSTAGIATGSILSIAWSFWDPAQALYGYLLVLFVFRPVAKLLWRRRGS